MKQTLWNLCSTGKFLCFFLPLVLILLSSFCKTGCFPLPLHRNVILTSMFTFCSKDTKSAHMSLCPRLFSKINYKTKILRECAKSRTNTQVSPSRLDVQMGIPKVHHIGDFLKCFHWIQRIQWQNIFVIKRVWTYRLLC